MIVSAGLIRQTSVVDSTARFDLVERRADLIEACSLSENRLRSSSAFDLKRRDGPRGRAWGNRMPTIALLGVEYGQSRTT